MPYLYKTEVRDSAINGKGLFAAEDIPKGVVYWIWHQQNPIPIVNLGHEIEQNIALSRQQLEQIKDEGKLRDIMRVSLYYAEADLLLYFRDGCQFMNHSFEPNSQIIYNQANDYKELKSITLKDIKKGDEICQHYGQYMTMRSEWINDLMKQYCPPKVKLEEAIMIGWQKEKQLIL